MKTHPDNIVNPESVNLGNIAIVYYYGKKREGFVTLISRYGIGVATPDIQLFVEWKDVLEISKPE